MTTAMLEWSITALYIKLFKSSCEENAYLTQAAPFMLYDYVVSFIHSFIWYVKEMPNKLDKLTPYWKYLDFSKSLDKKAAKVIFLTLP